MMMQSVAVATACDQFIQHMRARLYFACRVTAHHPSAWRAESFAVSPCSAPVLFDRTDDGRACARRLRSPETVNGRPAADDAGFASLESSRAKRLARGAEIGTGSRTRPAATRSRAGLAL